MPAVKSVYGIEHKMDRGSLSGQHYVSHSNLARQLARVVGQFLAAELP